MWRRCWAFSLVVVVLISAEDPINLQPRISIDAGNLGTRFRGNASELSHFKVLEKDGHWLLVGGRNAVYNLSLPDLKLERLLEWPSSVIDQKSCIMKGKSGEKCHNYIRVLTKIWGEKVLVCGTNSFNPTCRLYSSQSGVYELERELEGRGLCPYDPLHNSTALVLNDSETGDVFAATVADLSGNDPLIYRRSLFGTTEQQLRTTRNDLKVLNDPDFFGSFSDSEYVYFWLREKAVESEGQKRVYGRVARVCRNDRGGPRSSEAWASHWTSYLKARLNCSLPGNVAFEELEAISSRVRLKDGSDLIYAILSTADGPLKMSAVCAFNMGDVREVFQTGHFLSQLNPDAKWLPLPPSEVPGGPTRPGSCTLNSQRLDPDLVSFVHKNALIQEQVSNYFDRPLFIDSTFARQLTAIAVDPQLKSVDGAVFDVLFVGTNGGKVLKLVNKGDGRGTDSVLVESIRVFPKGTPVRKLLIVKESRRGLVVLSDEELRFLPLSHCANRSQSCSFCVRLQDPYCAWDLEKDRCVSQEHWSPQGNLVQNVVSGRSGECPGGDLHPDLYAVNDLYAKETKQNVVGLYTSESMGIAVAVTLALAVSAGFMGGLVFSRWRSHGDAGSSSSGSDYSFGRSQLTRHDLAAKQHEIYAQKDNYVLTVPEGSATLGRASIRDKHLLTLNNGTLPKDYRVKKVYL